MLKFPHNANPFTRVAIDTYGSRDYAFFCLL